MLFQIQNKLLSSESTIRKLTYQNKQLKTEQLLNKTFSHKNICSECHQNFSTCFAMLYPKGMGRGIQATEKTNILLSVMSLCGNDFHNDAIAHTYCKFIKVLSTEFLWRV